MRETSTAESGQSAATRRLQNLAGAMIVVLVAAVMRAIPIPGDNELIYLPLMKSRAVPGYLPGDWTFSTGFGEHAAFNAIFGPVVDLVGIEWLAVVGRVAAWFAVGWLIVSLGRRLGARWWASVATVPIFLGLDQSMGVGAEFLFSGFEAKALAWPLLLGALIAAIDRRVPLAAGLVGVAFSIHPAIGLWGGGALLASLLIMAATRAQALRWLPLSALLALPGLIPLMADLSRSSVDSESASFVVLSRIPHHADPFSFGERGPLIFGLILAFNFAWSWLTRSDFIGRLLGSFQVILAGIFLVGVVARIAGWYQFLLLLPFRVLPIVANLLFWLVLAGTATGSPRCRDWLPGRSESARSAGSAFAAITGGLAIVAVVILWNPVVRIVDDVTGLRGAYFPAETDLVPAMSWIAGNTDSGSVVALPPWNDQIFYLTERAQFVSWGAVPYDRPEEWRERLEQTVADPDVLLDAKTPAEARFESYRSVQLDRWLSTAPRYGIDYLVSRPGLGLEPSYVDSNWAVYDLRDR